MVAPELAKVIGVVETGPELVELLTRRLTGKQALVVLDTFEHLIPAVTADLLPAVEMPVGPPFW